jgi:predicted TIM-barrel enzyme
VRHTCARDPPKVLAVEQRPGQFRHAEDGARRGNFRPAEVSRRQNILKRLKAKRTAGKAIIGAGAGAGISAKFLHAGGADLIFIYNSGRFRMQGLSSWAGHLPFGDANAIVMEMGEREIMSVVSEADVIAGSAVLTRRGA